MGKKIVFRALLEVLGMPKEHVENALKEYVHKLKQEKNYQVLHEEYAEAKKQEKQKGMWSVFAELEVRAEKMEDLTYFCFEYMPSLIEILEPAEFTQTDVELTQFLNDLQAKLHRVDTLAKHLKIENDFLKKNMAGLLKNYITVLLAKRPMTSEQMHKLTGVEQNKLEDYLDILIDEGRVDLKEGVYYLKEETLSPEKKK